MDRKTGSVGRIGVCSWSLLAGDAGELVARVWQTGARAVQIALDPVRSGELPPAELRDRFADAGIDIVSGMMATVGEDYSTLDSIRRTGGLVPDATWEQNLAAARENAELAKALGIGLVTLHAGFIPHERTEPRRALLLDRLRQVADVFGERGVRLGLETGQETADTLLDVLAELGAERVGVNFDPANMILYGMGEPIDALRRLAPYVLQAHIKDAKAAARPGEWGTEVPAGAGEVDWAEFFAVLDSAGLAVDLLVEREAGANRLADIVQAIALARHYQGAGR